MFKNKKMQNNHTQLTTLSRDKQKRETSSLTFYQSFTDSDRGYTGLIDLKHMQPVTFIMKICLRTTMLHCVVLVTLRGF